MCKYFKAVEIEPEVRRLLIEEFGSIQEAKKDMDIFSKHLPEKLQIKLTDFIKNKYPYLEKEPDTYKSCIKEVRLQVQGILAALY